MLGMTSITFRGLSPDEIIGLVASSGLSGIEWGGDVHVPPGDTALARRVGEATRRAGLAVLSYGSYYRLGRQGNPADAFAPLLATARALGAPLIRVWAGDMDSALVPQADYVRLGAELKLVSEMAAGENCGVSLEYHRGTLTDCSPSALELLAHAPGAGTYWQPNPDISHGDNLRELGEVLPRLTQVHVFHWVKDTRRPLGEGEAVWRDYIAVAGRKRNYIMEFVEGDDADAFLRDAKTLKGWMQA